MREERKKGLIFVISGPSGSGKTTLLKNLLADKELKQGLVKPISFTTRPKRSSEINGKDYLFISAKQFHFNRRRKKFLEWTRYLDYYYATPKGFIERKLQKGRNILLCLDLKGALKIKQLYPKNTVAIFVIPPSLGALQNRIEKRCSKTEKEEILRRLRLARQEILASRRYRYCLVNKNLAKTVQELKNIVLREIGI